LSAYFRRQLSVQFCSLHGFPGRKLDPIGFSTVDLYFLFCYMCYVPGFASC